MERGTHVNSSGCSRPGSMGKSPATKRSTECPTSRPGSRLGPSDPHFVAVSIRIFVNETVELAMRDFKFYNCAATVRKSENTPCLSCVSSPWGCQWNTLDHTCSDKDDSITGSTIIGHRKGSECPRFENPDPVLIPVGYKTRISFEGINLNNYKTRPGLPDCRDRGWAFMITQGQGPSNGLLPVTSSYDPPW
ncbi:plexin-B2-like [Nematolebias whitei]|uniref:plexin-B2-like n=1 Tax=Nematolebias whitei TaxID=451745 RepID=UPI00189B0E19|nr:plexin-B2-like [Nematolebias whitei]